MNHLYILCADTHLQQAILNVYEPCAMNVRRPLVFRRQHNALSVRFVFLIDNRWKRFPISLN